MTNLIVFSKDRPMQLQALLDSIEIHTKGFFGNIDIVYLATNKEYDEGYELLKSRRPYVNYIKQTNFEDNIKKLFKMDYTCFAADDDIFYRDFNKAIFRVFDDPETVCFSLRLGLNINYCYSNDKPNTLKNYKEDGEYLVWNWRNEELDFGYPLSIISHVFKTDFIKALTNKIHFENPNTYEGALQQLVGEVPSKIWSYKEGRIFGVPANSVNSSWTNRNGLEYSYTTEELNGLYLSGGRIDTTAINPNSINAVQQEIPYVFI